MLDNATENKSQPNQLTRRDLLKGAVAGAASSLATLASAQSFDFKPNQR